MACVVNRVVICDAFQELGKRYEILPGGRSRLVESRRSSKRHIVAGRDARGGIAGVVGNDAELFEDPQSKSRVTPVPEPLLLIYPVCTPMQDHCDHEELIRSILQFVEQFRMPIKKSKQICHGR